MTENREETDRESNYRGHSNPIDCRVEWANRQRTENRETNYRGQSIAKPMERQVEQANIKKNWDHVLIGGGRG